MSIYFKRRILNEVYFANNRISELEKCIHEFRQDYWNNKSVIKKFNTHPSIIRFNRIAEDIFGFEGFMLIITPVTGIVNAMTMPVSYKFDSKNPKKMIMATNQGFKYKPQANYYTSVYIYSDLITRKDITDREVMAIILHEIGHNFQDAINDKSSFLLATKQVLVYKDLIITAIFGNINSIAGLLSSSNLFEKLDQLLTNTLIDKMPGILDIGDNLNKLFSIVNYIPNKIRSLFLLPLAVYQRYITVFIDPTKIGLLAMQYEDEKIADNFATMYGYGPDLSTANLKLNYKNDIVMESISSGVPVLSPILGLYQSVMLVLLHGVDCHPTIITRIDHQIEYLKKELKTCDPKVRKEIEKQIAEIEDILDKQVLKSRDIKDKDLFDKIYQSFIFKLLGKGQLREIILKDNIHSNVQNVFDRVKIR